MYNDEDLEYDEIYDDGADYLEDLQLERDFKR